MSGHSKWHSIRHKKAVVDAKRGKLFTRYIREITMSAKLGGGDPEANPRLRHAIEDAKSINMPGDNIKKAMLRGTGELDGVNYEDVSYEGYGPSGVAILVETLTDNRNRTVAEIRHVFGKYGGNLGENGCVAWMFSKKGLILINKDVIEEDELMEVVLEAGAEDLRAEGDDYEVVTSTADYDAVLKALKSKEIQLESSQISMIPSSYVKLTGKPAEQMLRLTEKLEELDDVQNVWANFDIPESEIEAFSK